MVEKDETVSRLDEIHPGVTVPSLNWVSIICTCHWDSENRTRDVPSSVEGLATRESPILEVRKNLFLAFYATNGCKKVRMWNGRSPSRGRKHASHARTRELRSHDRHAARDGLGMAALVFPRARYVFWRDLLSISLLSSLTCSSALMSGCV